MACHLSIFAVFLLVSATTFVSAMMTTCTIKKDGALTMFSGEQANVKVPCKYRLVDMKCSGYEVKVTPSSVLDENDEFSPEAVWVKITNLATNDYFVGRTSGDRISDHIADNTIPVWDRKDGNLVFNKEDYLNGRQYARLVTTGDKVKVQFAVSGNYAGVKVKCTYDTAGDFDPKAYPTSLCGGGSNSGTNVIPTRKSDLFGSTTPASDELAIIHDIFSHTNVIQSSAECKDAAQDFQNCENPKTESIQTCGPIFSDGALAGCLINNNNEIGRFQDCIKLACNNNMATCASKLQSFKNYVDNQCPLNTYASAFSALSCS